MTSPPVRIIRPAVIVAFVSTLWATATVGCDSGNSNTDPRPSCPPDAGTPCVGPTGGGSNPSGGSGGSGGQGGSSATNDVTGKVGVLNDLGFSLLSSYIGAATIYTTSNANTSIDAPYGESATSFTLLNVKTGPTWFFVQDQTAGATGVFSTHSVLNVPPSGPVTLPVVDRNIVTSIAGSLPVPIVIDGSRGILVLKVVRQGKPMEGVSLVSAPAGSSLAYDTGVGLYSNQTLQTGSAGVILAFNLDGPTNAQLLDLTLTDSTQQSYVVQVRVQAGAATFAGFEL